MTFEELLDFPDPTKLSDAELEMHLAPYLPLTRPRNLSPTAVTALPADVRARVVELQSKMGSNNLLKRITKS